MKQLYFDMDGVLAYFDRQPNALNRFITEEGFFQKLEPTALAIKLNELLGKDEQFRNCVHILSASPTSRADIDKTLWLYEHLPNLKSENIHIIRGGKGADERKAQYANSDSILLDDYSMNLKTWESFGGKGIKVLNGSNGKRIKWLKETLDITTI